MDKLNANCHCCSVAKSWGLFATPWNAACQASLSSTDSQTLAKLMPKLVHAFNLALFFGRAPTGLLTFFWDCHSGTEFKTIRNLTYLYLEKSSSGTMPADGDYGGDVALVYLLHPSH